MEMRTMVSQAAELKMPQAGGAAREPSMEEILASIRRIIEDSDQGRKPEVAQAGVETASAASEAAWRSVEPEAVEQPVKRDQAPDPVREERKPAAAVEALAPADQALAARHDAPAAPKVREREVAVSQPVRAASQEAEISAVGRADPAARQPEAPRVTAQAKPAAAESALASAESQGALLGEMDIDIEAGLAPVAPVAHSDLAAAEPAPLTRSADKTALISERTGRQVAAAFGELSEAFEASRRKSFDEIAAEMMRPMLQDWLDNNLPTLVEKLVREEIERVARGGR
jgi:cell pole-organizing protein PopZ